MSPYDHGMRSFTRFGVLVTTGLLMVCVSPSTAAPTATPGVAIAPTIPPPVEQVGSVRQPATVGLRFDEPKKVEPHPATSPQPATTPKAQPPKPASPKVVTLRPTPGNQADIDRCKLVLWMPNLIAGHNVCKGKTAWDFLDNIPNGTVVVVAGTSAAGRYVVYDHKWQSGKGGAVPGWMSGVALMLQTCTPKGTGFSLLRRA